MVVAILSIVDCNKHLLFNPLLSRIINFKKVFEFIVIIPACNIDMTDDDKNNNQFLLNLIKSCEKFNLTEKESLITISKVLGKDISRRTYYNYKKKLYGKETLQRPKDSFYDIPAMRCLLLDCEWPDSIGNPKTNIQITEQFPNRKDVFHNLEEQPENTKDISEQIKLIVDKYNHN